MIAICRSRTWSKPIAIAFLAALRSSVAAWCQEPRFIRGDANQDGAVTISDAMAISNSVSGLGPPLGCKKSADANDDGNVRLEDAVHIMSFLIFLDLPPCPPFPDPGTDPTPDGLSCKSHGEGSPLDDPEARVSIEAGAVDASGKLTLTLHVTNSRPVSGFAASVSIQGDILGNGGAYGHRHLAAATVTESAMRVQTERLSLAATYGVGAEVLSESLPPGVDVAVVEVEACVNPGTLAGVYELAFRSAELIDTETGKAIHPRTQGGLLVVSSPIRGELGQGCPDQPDREPETQCVKSPEPGPQGVRFVRGDVNGDGAVSIADAQTILLHVFAGLGLRCDDAADLNDDGNINLADFLSVLRATLSVAAPAIPAPFPIAGPDPTLLGDPLSCEKYPGSPPIDDASSSLRVLDADAPGGASAWTFLTVKMTAARDVSGLRGRITASGDIFQETVKEQPSFGWSVEGGGRTLSFYLLASATGNGVIPAGVEADVFEIPLCLNEGVAAGEYALEFEAGEIVAGETADGEATAIHPTLAGGALTVHEEVTREAFETCSGLAPPGPDASFEFSLGGPDGSVRGDVGAEIEVPFKIQSDALVHGFTYSIDFDEEVLTCIGADFAWTLPDGTTDFGFVRLYSSNDNENPGAAGIDEGFLLGTVLLGSDMLVSMPVGEPVEVLRFRFQIKPAPQGSRTELRFLDGGRGCCQPVRNGVIASAGNLFAADSESFQLLSGQVEIGPQGSEFIRGNSNGDTALNISDPQTTLGYLFLGSSAPPCLDAADANDDGRLDLADAIFTLGYLFLGGPAPPPPYPDSNLDPTPDSLGCGGE